MPVKRKSLKHNTFMLYLLTGSNYLFGLITIPYLTRVLGAELYGVVGVAAAAAAVLQLVVEFGFLFTGTIDVANNQDDNQALERVVTSVTGAKLLLVLPCLVGGYIVCVTVEQFSGHTVLFMLYFLYACLNGLMPDFLYRGLENMTIVTVRAVIIKAIFALGVFVIIRDASQYWLVPLLYCLGAAGAAAFAYSHMRRKLGIWFTRVSFADIAKQLKKSLPYFFSRIASTVFTSLNNVILGLLYPGGPVVGHYSACEKVIAAGRSAITPVTGSMFPHIVRTKNYSLVFKVASLGTLLLVAICILPWIYAEEFCRFAFGEEYGGAASLLRILLILIPLSLPSYLFGWSMLGALGLTRITNNSVFIGAAVQAILLVVLYGGGWLTAETVCLSTVVVEALILAIRMVGSFWGLREERKRNAA